MTLAAVERRVMDDNAPYSLCETSLQLSLFVELSLDSSKWTIVVLRSKPSGNITHR